MRKLLAITSILVLAVISIGAFTAAVTGPPSEGVDREFSSIMSGAQEVPDNTSALTGRMVLRFSEDFSEARFRVEVTNNNGTITAAHIHCEVAGVNGPIVVPLFVGAVFTGNGVLVQGTITNADITARPPCPNLRNVAALAAAMMVHETYLNVHTQAIPGGETRGQLFGRYR